MAAREGQERGTLAVRRRKHGWVVLFAATAWSGLGADAHAQLPETLRHVLTPGRRTRVELVDSARLSGRVQLVSPDVLTLTVVEYVSAHRATEASREIPADSVTRIWVASGTHWTKGAWIGATVGAGYAFAMALVFGGGGDSPECRGPCLVGFTAGGATLGGTLGAAIGLFFLRWKLVF